MATPKITVHLSVEELSQRYRNEADPIIRIHWYILWLTAQGYPDKEVIEVTGYSDTWVYAIVRQYNEGGPDAIGGCQHQNSGESSMISQEILDELDTLLEGPAPDGGLWTSKKVAKCRFKNLIVIFKLYDTKISL